MKASLPSNETGRLQALSKYEILDTAMESAFDDLTRLAASICGVPMAMVSLIDRDRQWFKSKIGIEICETSRDFAFCAPHIRFYAGAPLIDPDGFALGTLCLIDYIPRHLSVEQQEALVVLSRQVMMQLTLRRNLVALRESTTRCQIADEAMQQMIGFQKAILDGANYSIISTTKDGIIQTVNATTGRWLGYTAQELIGQTPALFHDITEVKQYAWELSQEMGTTIEPGFEVFVAKAQSGQADERQWTYIRADGSRFPVLLSVTALHDTEDSITGFIGIAKDISDRFLAQKALQASEQKYRSVVDNVKEVIFQTDTTGLWTFLNPAWTTVQVTAFTIAQSLGTSFLDYIHERDHQHSLEVFQSLVLGRQESCRHEVRYLTKWRIEVPFCNYDFSRVSHAINYYIIFGRVNRRLW